MHRLLKAALLGGLIAGTLDIGAACLINGVGPAPILRYIASGLLGRAHVANGGTDMLVLGLVLQWAMSILIAAIYAFAAERLPALTRQWVPMGLVYGVVVFVVMTFVVQPLSAAPNAAHLSMRSAGLNLLAMLVFGLIVAATTRQVFRGRA
jgi:uncharacterized membrane protein YagU involved in acid resistance